MLRNVRCCISYFLLVTILILPSLACAEVLANNALFLESIEEDIFKVGTQSAGPQDLFVDYVLVRKAERKLYLYSENKLVKEYPIALGKNPAGQKVREGDSKTPEGLYTLDWRNPNSRFFRSIHVSYPNANQIANAKRAGIDPGGHIMIHGQPNKWGERIKLTFADKDWTEGCIAVENQDMLEIWDLVPDGTPIKIEP